jgi:DNA-binding NarL/FixJ family response regulator
MSSSNEQGQRPRIVLGDDHTFLAEALSVLLTEVGDVVGTASDGDSLLRLVEEAQPDLVITDLTMQGGSGFDVLRALQARPVPIPVLVLTMHSDIGTLRTAMGAGASGYVLKNSAVSQLAEAVRVILGGEHYIPPALREDFASAPRKSLEELSLRQRSVLEALARGASGKAIAAELGITPRTVAFHCKQLRKKLGPLSVVEMVELLREAERPRAW